MTAHHWDCVELKDFWILQQCRHCKAVKAYQAIPPELKETKHGFRDKKLVLQNMDIIPFYEWR